MKTGMPTVDLSDDSEAQVTTSSSTTDFQLARERVIAKVFSKYGVTVDVTPDITNSFKQKLWRMGQALSKCGGTGRRNLIEKWKGTVWMLKISHLLVRQKRKLEQELKKETEKRLKLQYNSSLLKKEVKSLKNVTIQQARTIVSLKTGKSPHRRSSKRWSSYSSCHRSVKRKTVVSEIKASLSVCDDHFRPLTVDVENIESGEKEVIDLESGKFLSCKEKPAFSTEDIEHFALYVKDQFAYLILLGKKLANFRQIFQAYVKLGNYRVNSTLVLVLNLPLMAAWVFSSLSSLGYSTGHKN